MIKAPCISKNVGRNLLSSKGFYATSYNVELCSSIVTECADYQIDEKAIP